MEDVRRAISIVWLRRDLRLHDNAALYHALKGEKPVLCLFIFDKEILERLPNKRDTRLAFIHKTLLELKAELNAVDSDLLMVHDKPLDAYKKILADFTVDAVFTNRDYEPYAIKRDREISAFLNDYGIKFKTFKDQVIFEPNEVSKPDGLPYVIYTPFSKKWLDSLNEFYLKPYPTGKYFKNLAKISGLETYSLEQLGFEKTNAVFPSKKPAKEIIKQYDKRRDYPGVEGTTHMGLHLRFGTVSVRELAATAHKLNVVYLKELIWREFFMHILFHFPHVEKYCFRQEYERIRWRNDEKEFEKWCKGETGYPIVDAGMRELNATGFMHNRVRMVTASFLTKHLLIDWRWGERYFAEKLLDYDMAANVGNWQWAAGCGCDAAPYFRVFNPQTQAEKFDPDGKYIRKWVPELDSFDYKRPMVEHNAARERAIKVYREGLKALA